MAELSADALAIVDRLKREGDLNRNSGTNSIRSVKIELSKFQDIFKSISTNISEQAEVLKVQTNLAKEAAEKAETQEQFKEIEPKTAYEKDDEPKSKLVTESENKKINAMGDAIRSALSFKNLALAGAGLFVGYNFLKGFIDEKTGGGFTEFEKNIGPFAKRLPEMAKVFDDFPTTLRDMKTSIEKMEKSVTKFTEKMGETVEKLTTIGGLLGIAINSLTALTIAAGLVKIGKNLTKPGAVFGGTPTTVPSGTATPTPEKADASTKQGTTGKQSTSTQGQTTVKRTPNGSTIKIAKPTGAAATQADKSTASREKTIRDPKMSKVYSKITKALPAIGIYLTAYQFTQLVGLLDDPKSTQKDKQVAVSVFLSEMIGAFAGGTAGAIMGAFGGPWGSLIFGVIGAGLGALGGGLIAEYIAKWAFEEGTPSQEDIDKKNRQIGIDQYLDKVDARPEKPMNPGKRGFGAQAKAYANWNAQYSETHNPDGTAKASISTGTTSGGRGSVVEQPGEREAYMKAQSEREAALKEINKSPNSVLTDTPESMVTGSTNRKNGLNTVSGSGGGGSAVIINAPVSAPSSVNVSNGGSSVNQLSISGGGGAGIGPSMLPYGLTNAYN